MVNDTAEPPLGGDGFVAVAGVVGVVVREGGVVVVGSGSC
jgi:hypothetical protein